MCCSVDRKSQQRNPASSSYRRNAANEGSAPAGKRTSDRDGEVPRLSTKVVSILAVMGSFFTFGLASLRCKPARVARTNAEVLIGGWPASWWAQLIALTASSTRCSEVSGISPHCCRGSARWTSSTGKLSTVHLLWPATR